MLERGNIKTPDGIFYHKEHCWAKDEGDHILVGWTDFAQQLSGTIKRVVTLEEDDEVGIGKPFGTISSGKWTGKIYAPVSGEIIEVNEDLEDEPSSINEDPYGEGWLIKVAPSNKDGDLATLMKPNPDFEAWLQKEIAEKNAMTG